MQKTTSRKLFLSFVLIIACTLTRAEDIQEPIHNRHEVECLTKTIYFEARGEPVKGQMAVAWVTLNRVKHEKFPDTVCGVVHQPGQYSWVGKGYKIRNWGLYFKLEKLAKSMIRAYNNGIVPNQIKQVKNAIFFDSLVPDRARGAVKIGSHNFYNSFAKRQDEI